MKKPRPVLWVCSATVKGKPVLEAVTWKASLDPKQALDLEKGEQACRAAFRRQYGVDPVAVYGPVYCAKGTSKRGSNAKVRVPAKVMVFKTTRVFSAEYMGWKVVGNGLKAGVASNGETFKSNELIAPYVDKQVDPKAQLCRLGTNTALRLSELKNVREVKQ